MNFRITRRISLGAVVLFGIAATATTSRATTAGVRDLASSADSVINEKDVRRILSTLAADSMEGRMTGTPGANRAARFISSELRAIGLAPAGDSGYYQKVALAMKTVGCCRRM